MDLRTRALIDLPVKDGEGALTVDFATVKPVRCRDWRTGRYYNEILVCGVENIVWDRLNNGVMPVNVKHFLVGGDDVDNVVGVAVKDSGTADGSKATCRIKLSELDTDKPYVDKIQAGFLKGVSVGYIVHTWERILHEDDTVD